LRGEKNEKNVDDPVAGILPVLSAACSGRNSSGRNDGSRMDRPFFISAVLTWNPTTALPAAISKTYWNACLPILLFMRSIMMERIEMHWDGKKLSFPEGFAWEGTMKLSWINQEDN